MVSSVLAKVIWLLAGLVVGGVGVFVVFKVTEGSGDSDEGGNNSTGSRVNDSLQYVVVISRHGNRATFSDYPLDPYPVNDTDYYPYGINALTPEGRVQAYNLGGTLRSLYNGFLPSTFVSSDIYACSDLYERVIMSGDLVLAGLYPPHGWQVWHKDIHWQPIALYTNSTDHTQVVNSCPRYIEEKNITYSEFLEEDAANITALINYVYNWTGETLTADDLSYMFEKVLSEETEGYTLPTWVKNIYSNLTDFYGPNFVASCAGSDEVIRLWVGNLFEEILDSMKARVNGTSSRKISYYSGHDVTLLTLQVALGVPRSSLVSIIKPASAIVVELHKDSSTNEYSVQVVYLDSSDLNAGPLSLDLPYCGDHCLFTNFFNSTKQFTDVNFEEECQSSVNSS